jgi:hypothetical protein
MARLGTDRDFLWKFGKLERAVQDRVYETFAKFERATHAGMHLEPIRNVRDHRLRSIRIDQFWRGVVLAPDSGDSYTLLKVLPRRLAGSTSRSPGATGLSRRWQKAAPADPVAPRQSGWRPGPHAARRCKRSSHRNGGM